MCIRLWLEVGHRCEARTSSSLGRSITLDWRVWVKSASGHDISPFVQKVVFYLHPASAFVYPKRGKYSQNIIMFVCKRNSTVKTLFVVGTYLSVRYINNFVATKIRKLLSKTTV